MHNYHITYQGRSYLQSLLCVGCNGECFLGDCVTGAGVLQRSKTVAPTRGLQRGMGFEELRIRSGVASMAVDRASPVFSADEDVHNPSVDGLGTSWGVGASTVGDRRSYAWVATGDGI